MLAIEGSGRRLRLLVDARRRAPLGLHSLNPLPVRKHTLAAGYIWWQTGGMGTVPAREGETRSSLTISRIGSCCPWHDQIAVSLGGGGPLLPADRAHVHHWIILRFPRASKASTYEGGFEIDTADPKSHSVAEFGTQVQLPLILSVRMLLCLMPLSVIFLDCLMLR